MVHKIIVHLQITIKQYISNNSEEKGKSNIIYYCTEWSVWHVKGGRGISYGGEKEQDEGKRPSKFSNCLNEQKTTKKSHNRSVPNWLSSPPHLAISIAFFYYFLLFPLFHTTRTWLLAFYIHGGHFLKLWGKLRSNNRQKGLLFIEKFPMCVFVSSSN